MKIKSIKKHGIEKVYDLEIKDNHNFFANKILVHNCRGLMKKLGKADKKQEDIDKWNEIIKKFEIGAKENGLSVSQSKQIADDMLAMSSYSFNRCFSGDCKIDRDNKARWSPTIEEMYLTKNNAGWAKANGHTSLNEKYRREGYGIAFSLNENNRLYPNKIVDIYFQGEKEVFLIELENGKSIEVTSNHSFPVLKNGSIEYISIDSGLCVGGELFSNEGYKKDFNERYNYNFSDKKSYEREFKNYSGCGFKDGEENSAYINGIYMEFRENFDKKIKEAGGICEWCGKKTKKIEIHHKDFSRLNNEINNLCALCPSCHKKEHYKNGRVRKNEKGKETKLVKVVKITSIGKKNTYDVEMENPYHTLSVNGIVAKNSHAVAYSYVALMTMYMSYYFQKYFYSSIIEYTMDNSREDTPQLLRTVRNSGYDIMPPDINKSQAKTYADGNTIFIGLHNLKQIGDSADVIIKNRPYNSFIDFIVKNLSESKINKRSISSLVKFGCFDELEPELNRRQMNNAFIDFWDNKKAIKKTDDLKSLIEGGKDLVDILNENKKIEDLVSTWNTYKNVWKKNDFVPVTTDYLKELESDSLGFNYFISPFSKKEMEIFREGDKKCVLKLSFDDIDVKDITWKVPVFIESLRLHTDKNGNEMAFVTIEDTTGMAISVPIFASFWQFLFDKVSTNSIALFSLYRNKDNQIMFGVSRFLKDEKKIKSLIMPIRRKE